jgi:hypothetical protein
MKIVESFERALFGSYTGTPEARREFIRKDLLGRGYVREIVERVMREEDARLARMGATW